ncbi:Small-conductance mechanosensitive channel [Klebsiella sp. PL-2018]|nr:Small-conductance mechanosensitive channel [Klebsiella sp. PL-2018]
MKPAKPAVALLKDIGEAGKHNHFTEEVGAEVITVAEGHNKSQPSGCLLGASSLNFTVRVWVKNAHYWDTYYDLLENIKEALDEHHIAIPYPQMDIRVAGTVPTLS